MIVGLVVSIGGAFLGVISWFAILFTGKHPRGMWEFMLKVISTYCSSQAYVYLMTDEYPKFGGPDDSSFDGATGPDTFAPPRRDRPLSVETPSGTRSRLRGMPDDVDDYEITRRRVHRVGARRRSRFAVRRGRSAVAILDGNGE